MAQTVGRRKSAVAQVRIFPGKGVITVNKRPVNDYFQRVSHLNILLDPLKVVSSESEYDILVSVRGGGQTGQAGAIRLGIARGLEKINGDFRPALKSAGFLTRDAREVERKKYGQPGARKKFQFSKR
ncbi:MAG: 30S ribosomal protein S9 [Candidatus Marinimicrobia bacterium]|nr:30S ribosomal protein S9 [Candidatus Neomarinimicrobiota bacterium]